MNNNEKRTLPDRRKRPTPVVSKYTFVRGRRKTIRRETDKKKYHFVDLYSPGLLIILLMLLLFNYIDTYLTLMLIRQDIITEANPFMALHLENGILAFIINKTLITGISLIIICIFINKYIAKLGLLFSIIAYSSVIMFEFYLLYL